MNERGPAGVKKIITHFMSWHGNRYTSACNTKGRALQNGDGTFNCLICRRAVFSKKWAWKVNIEMIKAYYRGNDDRD